MITMMMMMMMMIKYILRPMGLWCGSFKNNWFQINKRISDDDDGDDNEIWTYGFVLWDVLIS